MDPNKLFQTLGGIAGLAGIALGVVLLVFQGVLQSKFLPGNGINSVQAYHVLMALMVLTFGLAGVGVVAWLIFAALPSGIPLPQHNVYVLAFLVLAVLATTIFLGSEALDRTVGTPALPPLPTSTSAPTSTSTPTPTSTPTVSSTPTPAPTSTPTAATKQEITRSFRVCTGEYERACDPHDAYLYCYVDVNAWAKAKCDRFKIQQLNSRDGNKCGYSLYEVLCTSTL